MDEFIGDVPKTEVVDGLFIVYTRKGKLVLPIAVARRIVEKAGRQLDAFDRKNTANVRDIKSCRDGPRGH